MFQYRLRRNQGLIEMHRGKRAHAPPRRQLRAIIRSRDHFHAEVIGRGEKVVVTVAGNGEQEKDGFHLNFGTTNEHEYTRIKTSATIYIVISV